MSSAWDGLYSTFEDIYRGSYEEIQDRFKVYLADLPNVNEIPGFRVLDVGCGRGEWLDLLKQNGVSAYGVDTNIEVVRKSTDRGLDVRQEDVLEHMRGL